MTFSEIHNIFYKIIFKFTEKYHMIFTFEVYYVIIE